NPKGLELTIEGNVVMAVSRTLFEEVAFDHDQVLSVDWTSYPILEIQDAPEQIDIVLINRPEKAATGAGEPATRTVPAAIANAIFDATGVRRSEEHTSELQSLAYLVCRLLLEKKKVVRLAVQAELEDPRRPA